MITRFAVRAAAIAIVVLWTGSALALDAKTGNPVIDRAVGLVEEHFFSADALPVFRATVAEVAAEAAARPASDPMAVGAAVDRILASLNASHTARYTPDTVAYYELADVFRYAIREDVRRLFPPQGRVSYDGIGIATRTIDGKLFVSDVYDDGPAAEAGVLLGDEVLSADGAPFAEIGSFKGKAGRTVDLEVRRTADGAPLTLPVKVENLQATEALVDAIAGSVRVIDAGGKKIGVIHLWTYTSDRVTGILYEELGGGRLEDIDGLVLDLRSRWGGAPADAAETFVGGTGDMTLTGRDGEITYANTRFHKPVVAIIDEGSRSGMEILAYALKKNGIPLVGTTTAQDVVAGTGYLLPDDSLLVLAVADVHVDGVRLEGKGVSPDIAVPFDIRYANGADPQFDAALAEMEKRLSAGVN